MNILKKLDGNKTYIGMVAMGILGFSWSQGWISDELAKSIGALVTAWTGIAIRSAWKKGK